MTTEASKEGHNLEFCDRVIFNDLWWTPAAHEQAEGRAYGRVSNPHPIDAVYMCANAEIIIWLRELIQKKQNIISSAVEGVAASREKQTSIAQELIQMMKASMAKRAV